MTKNTPKSTTNSQINDKLKALPLQETQSLTELRRHTTLVQSAPSDIISHIQDLPVEIVQNETQIKQRDGSALKKIINDILVQLIEDADIGIDVQLAGETPVLIIQNDSIADNENIEPEEIYIECNFKVKQFDYDLDEEMLANEEKTAKSIKREDKVISEGRADE